MAKWITAQELETLGMRVVELEKPVVIINGYVATAEIKQFINMRELMNSELITEARDMGMLVIMRPRPEWDKALDTDNEEWLKYYGESILMRVYRNFRPTDVLRKEK